PQSVGRRPAAPLARGPHPRGAPGGPGPRPGGPGRPRAALAPAPGPGHVRRPAGRRPVGPRVPGALDRPTPARGVLRRPRHGEGDAVPARHQGADRLGGVTRRARARRAVPDTGHGPPRSPRPATVPGRRAAAVSAPPATPRSRASASYTQTSGRLRGTAAPYDDN